RRCVSRLCPLSFHSSPALHTLHSFPTRRSSDLVGVSLVASFAVLRRGLQAVRHTHPAQIRRPYRRFAGRHRLIGEEDDRALIGRSEEHTSELQSPYELVCRLLLEKKKQRLIQVN